MTVRAATSCAGGLPRVAVGCEGACCASARVVDAVCWSRPANSHRGELRAGAIALAPRVITTLDVNNAQLMEASLTSKRVSSA